MSQYVITAKITGATEFKNALDKMPEKVSQVFSGVIKDYAKIAQDKAKSYAPFMYGALRDSIHTDGPTVTPNNVKASVSTDLFYATYQEFGTGIYGPNHTPITPKNGRFLVFEVGGKKVFARQVKGSQPKKFFERAANETSPEFNKAMADALVNIVSFLATS